MELGGAGGDTREKNWHCLRSCLNLSPSDRCARRKAGTCPRLIFVGLEITRACLALVTVT